MYTLAPRLTRRLRLGLSVFIMTCLSVVSAVSHPPKPTPKILQRHPIKIFRTWELPGGAILRLGKGVLGGSDRAVTFSPDRNHIAVAGGIGL